MSTEADDADSSGIPEGSDQRPAGSAVLPFPVAGIGASAGGIEAVSELLANMPTDSGMALVVVQHLPPDDQSRLAEIFTRHTPMPVFEIEHGMKLAPNGVYVIRPAFSVTLDGGSFALGELVEERGDRRPIDDFFRSLARVQQEKAIAVILSGVGTHGTSGARAIKAAGGVCIAQDPETADFSGMPRSVISSGYADHICNVAQIPQVLIRYIAAHLRSAAHTALHRAAATGKEQLQTKIAELEATTNDLSNLLSSTEQALKSSQARLQSILEQLPIAMLMVDAASGALLHANPPAAQLMNLPYPVPTIGSDWKLAAASFQGTHPDGRPYKPQDWPLARSLTDAIAVADQEIEFRNAEGCLSMSSTPILDSDGKMVAAVATMFDITGQRRAAKELRDSEQRLQLLIDSALDYAIFMLDLQGRIISWNRGAERLLGWTEEEAIGRSGELIFTPEDRVAGVPEKEMETARRDGRAVDERVHQRKKGERFWASGMLMGVFDEKGTLCRYAKIIRDETERKRAEEDLQRALHEAERVRASAESANRAKDEFISTISHELRTPLNTIRLWARMLGSERLSEQDRSEGVRMIDRSAEAQQHLIDDLLDVSRMSSGQLRLNLRLTRLADVIRSAIESVRPSADVRKIQIVADLSDDVGVVRADPERIQQVLLNLIANAVKFTPGGGRIDVEMTRNGNDVIIVVKDTGIGIRPEFLPHVFERFRQAEVVTTRQYGGVGLGLAIAKQLIELHGGSIVAASEGQGKGATFTVTLPFPPSAIEQHDLPSSERSVPHGIRNLRILLVEDDAGSRLATCRALDLRGAIMDAVPNASLAMIAYSQSRPDAMILDIGLPAEDGYSLIARIREFETAQKLSRVPAVALTAFARVDDRERAFAAGFDEHLAKPVDIEKLVATLLRLTRRDRS